MKITRIETLPIPMGYRDFIACRVFTDEGLTGIGEPYPVGPNDAVAAVIADFATWLVGRDPRDITGIWQHLYAHTRFPGGSVVNAAISVALGCSVYGVRWLYGRLTQSTPSPQAVPQS